MKGLWLENGKLEYLQDMAKPRAAENELLLKTLCTGICGTDVELHRGYYDFTGVPGHEFVGEVVSAGSWHGKRVVASINIGCGRCAYCQRGLANHCKAREVIGIKNRQGAFAEYLTVPGKNCFVLPEELSNHMGVLVEPVAAALEIVEQVKLTGIDEVLVVGAGRLGVLIATVLASFELRVSVLVRTDKRREYLQSDTINIVTSVAAEIYPLVIECSGQASGFSSALAAVKARGTIVMKSTYKGELTFNASKIVVDEICLQGSRCGPFAKAIAWLQENSLSALTFERFRFDQVAQAFSCAEANDVYKVVFEP